LPLQQAIKLEQIAENIEPLQFVGWNGPVETSDLDFTLLEQKFQSEVKPQIVENSFVEPLTKKREVKSA
jgi:hypothetical protein